MESCFIGQVVDSNRAVFQGAPIGGGTQHTGFNKGFTKGICISFIGVYIAFFEGNLAGTSSEMTRRQSRRVISKERRRWDRKI